MTSRKFYITAAIPYVNAAPHIGHALEYIYTDTIARYMKIKGFDVTTLCGADENALKNVQSAEAAGEAIHQFIDKQNKAFVELTQSLDARFTIWQRGSDRQHHTSSQKLWGLCQDRGDIYKELYTGLYCSGCEAFYTNDELDENKECFEHKGKTLDKVREENYFFRLSKYQDQLIELIDSNKLEITPSSRKNEVLSFIKGGLKDISISRSNTRAKDWGVEVPGDADQRMYVWFDALNIYQSGIGFGTNDDLYQQLWPADLHVIGKGILRFHAVYWPAFLLSAGLKIPKKIFVHEYFTVDGQKMSKTLGNVYDPLILIDAYGADSLRYYCLAKMSPFTDGDFSEEKFIASYNSDLANGLGNTIQRVATLCERSGFLYAVDSPPGFRSQVDKAIKAYRFDLALTEIWETLRMVDKTLENDKPWKLGGKKLQVCLMQLVAHLRQVGYELQPFMPNTAKTILQIFNGPDIKSISPMFPRLEV